MSQDQHLKTIRREKIIKLSLLALALLTTAIIIVSIPAMLTSFLIGFVVTYLFKPIVSFLERKGFDHPTAVVLPFLLSGFLMVYFALFITPVISEQFDSLETELPKYITGFQTMIDKPATQLNKTLAKFGNIDVRAALESKGELFFAKFISDIPNFLSQLALVLLLAPLFAFFMLKDGKQINRAMLSLVPNSLFETSMNLFYKINRQLGDFIRARFLESLLVGGVVWIGFFWINLPYALFLAIFAGVTNLIPYFGPIIGAVPGLIIASVNSDLHVSPYLVGFIYLFAQVLDMLVLVPILVAKIVDLHPVTVIVVIILGGQIMGPLGMIISVPLASILKLTVREFYHQVVDFQ